MREMYVFLCLQCEKSSVPPLNEQSLSGLDWLLKGPDGVQEDALPRALGKDDCISYLMYLLFDRMQFLVPNDRLYSNGEKWSRP